jgi:hypothetical protein
MKFLADLGLDMSNFDPSSIDPNSFGQGAMAGGAMGVLFAFLMGIIVIVLIVALLLYIYMSLAFMAIAKKNKQESPGLAWIPIVGPAIVAAKAAQMHWWPILLLIGAFVPVIGGIFSLAFAVFFVIWMWKTFEAVGKPGWWAIFMIIPFVNIVYFVFLGIAAWSK